MKILHYTIGFPPKRTGGLTSYALDLMTEQVRMGNEVVALYPGNLSLFNKKTKIKTGKKLAGITNFQIINSLPLPLIRGIKTPFDFMTPTDEKVYKDFLNQIKPDVIHVHTLMGLHKEFFTVSKSLGIKLVFTSHDYFGLAPVPEFYFGGKSYDEDNTNEAWNIMSSSALSTKTLRLYQIPFLNC